MTIDELKRIAGREKVGLGIIEKDHAITFALLVLSKSPFSSVLVFKGGTAIKKMYYPEARFSEDLDFDCSIDIAKELANEILQPLTEDDHGVNYTGIKIEESRADQSRRLSLQYKDASGYSNSIKLDLAFRETPIKPVKEMDVQNLYGISASVRTMNIEEIFAEKVRALIHTARPRHLHDVWFLASKSIGTTKELLDEKLKLYGKTFEPSLLEKALQELERDWQADLQSLMSEVPEFSTVRSEVIDVLSNVSAR